MRTLRQSGGNVGRGVSPTEQGNYEDKAVQFGVWVSLHNRLEFAKEGFNRIATDRERPSGDL